MQQGPLLATKLYIPPLRPELVSRPRLIESLNAGLHRKLTLISAPAGFGKTTLVSDWVYHVRAGRDAVTAPLQIAWLSLDKSDNDPVRFLTYFVAALQTIGADIGKEALSVLQSPQPPVAETILTTLINEIAASPGRIALVLDDYHLIEARPIHNTLTFLLKHLPPQMHLVIATREDPPLPLARLRARGQLTELRITDLRFTAAEAADFFNQVLGPNLSAGEVASLETRTEGWIAGLQLASLALQGTPALQGTSALQETRSTQGRKDVTGFIKGFAGDNRYIVDYLVEEVLLRQPEGIRNFLLQTSILDRLSGPLCDAVRFATGEIADHSAGAATAGPDALRFGSKKSLSGQEEGTVLLDALERGNLFVIPLDDKRQWYRYHHLFADVLQAHLMEEQPDRVPTLHQRASEWYERNGLPSDSIRHALAARDFERAAALAELAWPAWSGSYQSIAWLGWVKELPDELVRARPVLSMAFAWAFLNAGMLEAAEARLLDAEQWLRPATDTSEPMEDPSARTRPEVPPEPVEGPSRSMVVVDEEQFRSLPVSLATARAYHAQAIGDMAATVKHARRVVDLSPEEESQWHGDASALLGLAYWANGDLVAAHQTFSHGLTAMTNLEVIIGTFVLADIKMTLGHLHEAARAYERSLQLAAGMGEPLPLGTEDLYTGMSTVRREWGDLEGAAQDLLTAKRLGEQVELPDWQYRWCIAQARLKESLEDLDSALDLLDEAERLYVRTPLPEVRPIAALKARIWAAQGRIAEALNWAREQGLSVDDDLSYLREFEHVTLARVLIARYMSTRQEHSMHEAIGLLERLLRAAEEGRRTGNVIEILVLQALAHEARGDIPPALVSLERALALAEPEGYVRMFVDEGPAMAALLREAAVRGASPDYVSQLRAAFGKVKRARPGKQPLVEPLSEREIEVLQLVAQGLSNREIGERLFLALNTVKGHNRNIFGKLEVQRRTEAVARARELGLL